MRQNENDVRESKVHHAWGLALDVSNWDASSRMTHLRVGSQLLRSLRLISKAEGVVSPLPHDEGRLSKVEDRSCQSWFIMVGCYHHYYYHYALIF